MERIIKLKDLNPAVAKAVKKQYPKVKAVRQVRETIKGVHSERLYAIE